MKVDINYVDDPKTLDRWNFKEPAIEIFTTGFHTAIPISKVNGYILKTILLAHKGDTVQ